MEIKIKTRSKQPKRMRYCYIDPEMDDELADLAAEHGTSTSDLIRQVLTQWLEATRKEKQR